MSTITAQTYRSHTWLTAVLLTLAVVGVSYSSVQSPWLVAGAVLGLVVLAVGMVAPLALVALMLVIGPIDLSFATGGFKSLFTGLGGLDMNGIRLVGASAGFMAYIMFEPRSRAAAAGPLGRTWIVFLAFSAATIALSLDRLEGLRLLFKLAYPFLTFLIVIGVASTRARAFELMKWTLATAAVYTLIINPILVANGGYHVDYEGVLRVSGLGIGHNPFAFYLLAMLLLVFARFTVRLQLRYLWFSVVLLGWMAATGTRIAALAAVVGMSVIGILAARSSGDKRILAAAFTASVVAGAIFLPIVLARSFGYVPSAGELLELVRNPLALYNSINWSGRQILWAVLWGALMASPIIGLGLGSSAAVIRETFATAGIRDAHNEYMRLATDIGFLGVLLFLIAVGTWLISMLRLSASSDRDVREFSYAGAALAIAFLIVAMTDNAIDFYSNFSQYLGLVVGCAVIAHGDAQQRSTGS
jgi:O-antigen ligase